MSFSPPAVSPPAPRPSPFSLLPNELVRSIIEATVPYSFHSGTYESRQYTLRSLCLVSKLFHQIARPLLFAVVQLTKRKSLQLWATFLGGEGGAGAHSRELVMNLKGAQVPTADLSSYLPSSLKTLVLSRSRGVVVDLTVLSQLSGLTTLRLCEVLCKIESDTVFPSLVELGLINVTWNSPVAETLNPTIFPRLKALAWISPVSHITSDMVTALLSLSEQLEIFSGDACDGLSWHPELRRPLEGKTLFDHQFDGSDDAELPLLPSIRLYDIPKEDLISCEEPLRTLATLIETSHRDAHPSLLYLPSRFKEAYFEPGSVNVEGLSFQTQCAKKKIEVRFEEEVGDWEFDSAISGDFWRLMKERRSDV